MSDCLIPYSPSPLLSFCAGGKINLSSTPADTRSLSHGKVPVEADSLVSSPSYQPSTATSHEQPTEHTQGEYGIQTQTTVTLRVVLCI